VTKVDLVVTGLGIVLPEAGPQGGDAAETWFDTGSRLGARGYKYLPPAARYLLAAARAAVADGGRLDHVSAGLRAAVVGTNNALATFYADVDRTVVNGHSEDLSPATAPYFAVNVLSGRLSAEHELRGFTLAVTSPRVAGLEAIELGARALAAGRCRIFLAAAMEHGSPAHTRPVAAEQGAVALVLEPLTCALARGARCHGSLRVHTMFAPPSLANVDAAVQPLASQMTRALAAMGVDQGVPVHPVLDDSPVAKAALEALILARRGDHGVQPTQPLGAGCLTPMHRVATLIGTAPDDTVVVVATAEGNIAVVGLFPARPASHLDPVGSQPC
jgi:3-oxoacyl-[acyl-carrier-protein] synthase II